MKVAVECRSVLLQKALEKFLDGYLSSVKHSDIVIRDYKKNDDKNFFIATSQDADLVKPFSKSQLMLALQNRYKAVKPSQKNESTAERNNANFEILQKRIEMLTEEYKNNILEAIKAFYG